MELDEFQVNPFDATSGLLHSLNTLAVGQRVLMGVDDLPALLSLPGSTLAALFSKYGAPRSIVAGRRRLFRRADLEAWAAALPANAPLFGRQPTTSAG